MATAKSTVITPVKNNKPVVSPIPPVEKAKSTPFTAIEKHIKEFEPLELSEQLGFNAQKVYTVHNEWAKTKPLIEHLGKELTGKSKTQLAAFIATLDSINPNGS